MSAPVMTSTTAALACACGCGRPVEGRRATRRYYSDACRQRASRGLGSVSSVDSPEAAAPREPRHAKVPDPQHGSVTVTRSATVSCAGCGELMPNLEGPLPIPAYCRACVAAGACCRHTAKERKS